MQLRLRGTLQSSRDRGPSCGGGEPAGVSEPEYANFYVLFCCTGHSSCLGLGYTQSEMCIKTGTTQRLINDGLDHYYYTFQKRRGRSVP